MKLFISLFAVFILISSCQRQQVIGPGSDHPEVEYVRDQSLFLQEDDPRISGAELHAIQAAKQKLEETYDAKVRGKFSVAKLRTGYQINFYGLELERAIGQWHEIPEGFGEIFVSHDFKLQGSAIGP